MQCGGFSKQSTSRDPPDGWDCEGSMEAVLGNSIETLGLIRGEGNSSVYVEQAVSTALRAYKGNSALLRKFLCL